MQLIHHLEFVDAVEWLAARAGITLAPQSGEANRGAKTRLVAITRQAAEWYRRFEDMHEVKDLPKGTAALAKKLISKINSAFDVPEVASE